MPTCQLQQSTQGQAWGFMLMPSSARSGSSVLRTFLIRDVHPGLATSTQDKDRSEQPDKELKKNRPKRMLSIGVSSLGLAAGFGCTVLYAPAQRCSC